MQSYLQHSAFGTEKQNDYGRQASSMYPRGTSKPIVALPDSGDGSIFICKNDTHGTQEITRAIMVQFEGSHDSNNPRNWSTWKRVFCTAHVGIIALVIGAAGAIDSPAIPQAATEFGVSHVVEALATGLVRFSFSGFIYILTRCHSSCVELGLGH